MNRVGGHFLNKSVMAVLVESSEQGWPWAETELVAANTLQSEKHPKAPPLPKYLSHQPGKGKVLSSYLA